MSHGHRKLEYGYTRSELKSRSLIGERKRRALSAAERGFLENWVATFMVKCSGFYR